MTNKVAVFISGRGSNLSSILSSATIYNFSVCCVVSSRDDAPGLGFAKEKNIPFYIAQKGNDAEDKILFFLQKYKPDLVCLAGFMKILSANFINALKCKIINIHPSLLPSFKGLNAQKQALDSGVKIAGCTVHFVNEDVDSGAIIIQAAVPVLKNDTLQTLSQRILQAEHKCYPLAIDKVLNRSNLEDYLFLLNN